MAIRTDEEKIKEAVDDDGSEKKVKKKKDEKKPELIDIPGVGPGAVAKLEAAGIYDLMGVAVLTPSQLAETAGMGEAAARKAIQAARQMMDLGFSDGLAYDEKRKEIFHITTGSKNLDNLLGGKGIETKAITEAFGSFGSGKCISKDTPVCYFNDAQMHVESIEETYEKYNNGQETRFDEGFAIPVQTVKVLAWNNGELSVVPVSYLYKEGVKNLHLVKTKRGRILRMTSNHQILSFNEGVGWKKTSELKEGDLIASPNNLDLNAENFYNEKDAYFLGLFAAEGSSNPFSICTGSEEIKNWLRDYIEEKFNYVPTVREDKRRENVVYSILLRNKTRSFMKGLDQCNSSDKFIPEKIFMSSEKVIFSFLGGYLDGDGEISDADISATTKSKKLATQLSYLLLRVGVSASMRKKIVDGREYFILRVSGEDREKMKGVKFLIKKFKPKIRNSSYGYPREIVNFFQKLYKECIGGNRGSLRKLFGKRNNDSNAYRNLTGALPSKVINEKTFNKIEEIFFNQKEEYILILKNLESDFSIDLLRVIYPKLPFAFNSLSEKMGVKKSTMRNYYLRQIPSTKKEILRNLIVNELRARVDGLIFALSLIGEIKIFKWDVVRSNEIFEYNDFVYDFVVPDGHSFVGGNMPTMMHNTQLGLSLAVNTQLPIEKGGANGKAIYIDTEGTFRPERIRQFAEGIGANPDKVLKNILVARAFNSDHQMLLLDKVSELIKNGEPIRLIVIDSLTAHFRAEFAGRGQLADRQQRLNRYLHNLMKVAETSNLAVYVTNQVMSDPAQLFGDPTKPIGGNIVGHACLTEDSLIQLADGSIKEIKNIGDEKIISNSSGKLVSSESEKRMINPDVKEIYNIKTDCQINCSGLHRFFTIENFNVVEREARELKKGDFVMQAGRILIEGEEQELPFMQAKKIVKISKESSDLIKEKLKKVSGKREDVCDKIGITPRQFRRVLNQSYPTSFSVAENIQNHFGQQLMLQIVPEQSCKHRNLMMPCVMNFNLAKIFGYFLGDGNLELRGLRFRDERCEVLSAYNELFKKEFNIDGKIRRISGKNCYNLDINSQEISDFFRMILPCVFDYIGRSKDEVVVGFIRGFFDAEGHANKKRALVSVSQKEPKVLQYIQMFLLRLGIRSTIKYYIGKKKISILRVISRDVRDYSQIGFTATDKQEILSGSIRNINNTYDKETMPFLRSEINFLLRETGLNQLRPRPLSYKWVNRRELEKAIRSLMGVKISDRQIKQKINFINEILNSDLRFEKIRETSVSDNDGKLLYDFSVPKNENYIANGFVVHNSTFRMYLRRGKKDSRVCKLIDSPNLPDNETVFMIEASGLKDIEV